MSLVFAAIAPHAPILLPGTGNEEEKVLVRDTIAAMKKLGEEFERTKAEVVLISSPHPDWGFNVPLYFLTRNLKVKIIPFLTGSPLPDHYYQKGEETYNLQIKNSKERIAVVASGDLSHCLKEDGPYGFHPDGPAFDKALVEYLKNSDVKKILRLDDAFPEAGECGLRSISYLLGILTVHNLTSNLYWPPEILSYEGPFGVGYLVANFKV